MGKSLPRHQDEEFVRSYLKTVKATEDEHGVLVETEFFYTGRAGVMGIHFVAVECRHAHNLSRPICRYRVEYPSAHVASLAATLFQGACKLDNMVGEYRRAEGEKPAPLWA